MSNYPTDGAEILDPPVKFRDDTLEAVKRFKASGPWTGTIEERMTKFEALHADLCRIYGKETTLCFGDLDENRCSGSSYFNRLDDVIVLNGKVSVVTYLHVWSYAIGKSQHLAACRYSVQLFARCFPAEFAQCHFEGHMLRKNTD